MMGWWEKSIDIQVSREGGDDITPPPPGQTLRTLPINIAGLMTPTSDLRPQIMIMVD